MSKQTIAVLGDPHFGCRNDGPVFLRAQKRFYETTFFPEIIKRNIKTVICMGDLFDRRKYINFAALHEVKHFFFDRIRELDLNFVSILGNHDVYFKDTNKINAPQLLLKEYEKNVHIISTPTVMRFGERLCGMVPWICQENEEECESFLSGGGFSHVFGHFEMRGFQDNVGHVNTERGFDPAEFQKFEHVISGHYHHMSKIGNIFYIGTPYQMDWSDYNTEKGFYIWDPDEEVVNSFEFIKNPDRVFTKIFYNDIKDSNPISKIDPKDVADSYVKLVVEEKKNPYLLDKTIKKLMEMMPAEIKIVEDYNPQIISSEKMDMSKDTFTILSEFVDENQDNSESIKFEIKSLMKEILDKAQDYLYSGNKASTE